MHTNNKQNKTTAHTKILAVNICPAIKPRQYNFASVSAFLTEVIFMEI